jgi:hypothetical protein
MECMLITTAANMGIIALTQGFFVLGSICITYTIHKLYVRHTAITSETRAIEFRLD